MPIRKTEFPIIKRDVNETYIALRLTDGYVNASACVRRVTRIWMIISV